MLTLSLKPFDMEVLDLSVLLFARVAGILAGTYCRRHGQPPVGVMSAGRLAHGLGLATFRPFNARACGGHDEQEA